MAFLTGPDGTRLHYEVRADGPPLVLHLGPGCDAGLWRAAGYLDPLATSHRCILFDHRGHGLSDKPRGAEAHHINRYVADVVALLDHLSLERAAFWGYSAGMSVGLKVAEENPTRISALIGSGGLGRATPDQLREIVARRAPERRAYGREQKLGGFYRRGSQPGPQRTKARMPAAERHRFARFLQALPT